MIEQILDKRIDLNMALILPVDSTMCRPKSFFRFGSTFALKSQLSSYTHKRRLQVVGIGKRHAIGTMMGKTLSWVTPYDLQ
ncbi:hypothetical protein RP75_15240 [Agrobacterium arsenijevicii]|uniref:Uncharacterized protein n=1 Tax=Agrobacterium arsenijevicii TaxID=1585697 RepID=A0ABR5D612_9HYPH|nr:hypothetical protein RP75_15240 [Agrobacterium arsenijevicii]